jgi:hypothetical protein
VAIDASWDDRPDGADSAEGRRVASQRASPSEVRRGSCASCVTLPFFVQSDSQTYSLRDARINDKPLVSCVPPDLGLTPDTGT